MIVIKDSLRSATPLREAWGMYPFLLYVHLYCFPNRNVEGRQVADPYGGQPSGCGGRVLDYFQQRFGVIGHAQDAVDLGKDNGLRFHFTGAVAQVGLNTGGDAAQGRLLFALLPQDADGVVAGGAIQDFLQPGPRHPGGTGVGGVSFVLYGMISAVGVRNVVENRVDLTKSRNLIIAAVIFVCGLGFSSTGGITFTVGSADITLTGLAIAALAGVILNALLPGNDYEFGKSVEGDASADLGSY